MYRQTVILFFLLLGIFQLPSFGQPIDTIARKIKQKTSKKVSIFHKLTEEGLPSIEITADLEILYNDRRYQKYHPSFIKIKLPDGDTIQQQIKTKTRGKFRCRTCGIPPIKIKFPKSALRARGYKKWNEYKIVYPCNEGQRYQDYIYKEYLIYKMFNILTPKSYRVELVDLIIKDSVESRSPINFRGFVIEDRDEMVKRLKCTKDRFENVFPDSLVSHDYAVVQVFQYMIANCDWLPSVGHNMDIIMSKTGQFYPVPFDFDFSGLVGTHYAKQPTKVPVENIYERYFLGHQRTPEELKPIIELFKSKKTEIFNVVKDFEYLSDNEKDTMISFLNRFYKTIDKSKKVKKHLCRVLPKGIQHYY